MASNFDSSTMRTLVRKLGGQKYENYASDELIEGVVKTWVKYGNTHSPEQLTWAAHVAEYVKLQSRLKDQNVSLSSVCPVCNRLNGLTFWACLLYVDKHRGPSFPWSALYPSHSKCCESHDALEAPYPFQIQTQKPHRRASKSILHRQERTVPLCLSEDKCGVQSDSERDEGV
jgi:hypothetical protein